MNPTHASFSCDYFNVFSCLGFGDFSRLLREDVGCMGPVAMVLNVVHKTGMLGPVENVVLDGDDSCFLSFTGDNEFVFVPVYIIEFEAAELADAHAGICKKIDDSFCSLASSTSITIS